MDAIHIKNQILSHLSGHNDTQVEHFIHSVCRELAEKGEQWALKRWRLLIQALARPRFRAAVFSQRLSFSFLARSNEADLTRKIMELDVMTLDKFRRFINKRTEKHDDPEVSSPRHARTRRRTVTFSRLPGKADSSSIEDSTSGDRPSRTRGHNVQ